MKWFLTWCLAVAPAALAQPCPARAEWPTQAWPLKPVDPVKKADAIAALEQAVFTLEGRPEERKGFRTNALVVVHRGAVVYEKYARGFDETKRQLSWSVAKSYSSTLVGLAAHQGLLDPDASVCSVLTEYADSPVCESTIEHFLTFSSGLQWQEEYENRGYQISSVISMLFGVGRRDQVKHVLTHRRLYAPGTQFNYSTGDAHVVAAIAKRALASKHGADAFWTQFFDVLGMSSAVFEEDVVGNPLGGSFVYATPRDSAKFGWFLLNDGCWAGTRLVPEGWVKKATTISAGWTSNRGDCSGQTVGPDGYQLPCRPIPNGRMFWLNQPPADGEPTPWPNAPPDAYAAQGHWGQRIVVVPSRDLVIVRFGDDRQTAMSSDLLVKHVLPLLEP
jgi:CubicO group peptidase (beta-lactamase class C family)